MEKRPFMHFEKVTENGRSIYLTPPATISFRLSQLVIRESNNLSLAGGAIVNLEIESKGQSFFNGGNIPDFITRMESGTVSTHGSKKLISTSQKKDPVYMKSIAVDKGEILRIDIDNRNIPDSVVDVLIVGEKEGEF